MGSSLLAGRRTVLTGGGAIGAAIARGLAAHGARVEVWDRDPAILAPLEAEGIGVRAVDLVDDSAVEQAAAAASEAMGGIDSLVTSAAIARFGTVEVMPIADWDATIDVNLRAVYITCRAIIPHMRRNGGGSIVNISSIGGLRGEPEFTAYCASKFAVIGFTQSLAREVGEHGIRVNSVCPGAVASPMNTDTMARDARRLGVSVDDIEQKIVARTSLRRLVDPSDVANAVVFLHSDLASCITAESLSVTGGVF
jgi:NAD(P)-dependent dehydrogenase (short-subunit alcohol dehydrogenase family)